MRSKIIWKWVLTGAFISGFIFHPFVMIINHFMKEPLWVHGHSVLDIILFETVLAFSQKMLSWSLSFVILGALIGLLYGRTKQAGKVLQDSEVKFRSVVQSATDAIASINTMGEIIFWNKAAQKIFGYTENEIIGQQFIVLMPERYREAHRKGVERLGSTGEAHVLGRTVELHGLTKEGLEFPLEFSLATWKIGDETIYTGIIRDISDRRKLEQEKEDSILKLKDALAKVKTLSGFLPICAQCKKIRDDKGYWNQIEGYIQKHSDAEFSHGMCPECSDKLYGKEDWYIEMKKENIQKE